MENKSPRRGNPSWKKGGPSPNPDGRRGRTDASDAPAAPVTSVAHLRADAWYNVATGVGTSRDKRTGNRHFTIPVTVEEAEDLYRGEPLAAKIIEIPPNEMLREGFRVSVVDSEEEDEAESAVTETAPAPFLGRDPAQAKPGTKPGEKPVTIRRDLVGVVVEGEDELAERKPGEAIERARAEVKEAGGLDEAKKKKADKKTKRRKAKDAAERVMQAFEDLGFTEALWEALTYARAYGGGAILIGANDGQGDLTKPLNVEQVSKVTYLHALESRECIPIRWYTDPHAPKFGKPALYRLNPLRQGLPIEPDRRGEIAPQIIDVHESRLMIFEGVRVSRLAHASVTYGWGDSVLTRAWPVLRDFNAAMDAAGALIADFAQGVFEMKNLYHVMAGDPDSVAGFMARIEVMEKSRSTLRSVLVDAEHEKYHREQTPVSGLPELIDRFQFHLAAVADVPLTLLFGMSPGGMNATGESDIRFFYDRTASSQRRKLGPAIRYLSRILFSAFGDEPDEWVVEFAPLWQPTEKEKAEARSIQASTDEKYVMMGAVTPDDIAVNRFGGAEYSFETHIDLDARRGEMMAPAPADIRDPNAAAPGAPVPGAPAPQAPPPPVAAGAPPVEDPKAEPVEGEETPDPKAEPVEGAAPGASGAPAAPKVEGAAVTAGDPIIGTGPGTALAKGAGADTPQAAAMNGAQVTAMISVVSSFYAKEIPRASAIEILTIAFPVTKDQAEAMLPQDFTPKPPDPPAFGGGPPGAGGPPFGGPKGPPGGGGGNPFAKKGGGDNPFAKKDADNFDPNQERDEDGKWTDGGGGGSSGGEDDKGGGGSSAPSGGAAPSGSSTPAAPSGGATPNAGGDTGGGAAPSSAPAGPTPSGSTPSVGGTPDTYATYFKDGAWAPERVAIHEKYTARVTDGVPTSDTPTVYMTGGGPASGKTTNLLENPDAGIPNSREAAHIDPDGAKTDIPEYKEGVARGDKGAAAAVHEESAHMSKVAINAAILKGHNVVYDSVGDSGIEKIEAKVRQMRAAGAKRVEANYATLDVEEAIKRSDLRAERTGRYVPHDYIRAAHLDVAATSLAAMERGTFDAMKLWDTTARKPVLLATYTKEDGIKVLDKEGYERYTQRGRKK